MLFILFSLKDFKTHIFLIEMVIQVADQLCEELKLKRDDVKVIHIKHNEKYPVLSFAANSLNRSFQVSKTTYTRC